MNLREYLKLHGLTHEEFARKIGVTRPLITFIANRKKNPSIAVIVQIEKVTNGDVTAQDLFNPEIPSKIKKKGRRKAIGITSK